VRSLTELRHLDSAPTDHPFDASPAVNVHSDRLTCLALSEMSAKDDIGALLKVRRSPAAKRATGLLGVPVIVKFQAGSPRRRVKKGQSWTELTGMEQEARLPATNRDQWVDTCR
jgi:hypothetical protein